METIERRKQNRFSVNRTAAAALDDARIGVIMDISSEGLAFRYVASPEESEQSLKGATMVSITAKDFTLSDIPCKVVTDKYLLTEYGAISRLQMFKCCLQFEMLGVTQKTSLDFFITNYTSDGADIYPAQ